MKNIVRKLRVSEDLSQEELAKMLGVSRHTVIQIEKGKQEPSGGLLIKIGNLFNKDPREIFFADSVVHAQHAVDEQTATSA